MNPVAGAEPREVMPLVSYRGSAEAVLHESREVVGHRQSAKQLLTCYSDHREEINSLIEKNRIPEGMRGTSVSGGVEEVQSEWT